MWLNFTTISLYLKKLYVTWSFVKASSVTYSEIHQTSVWHNCIDSMVVSQFIKTGRATEFAMLICHIPLRVSPVSPSRLPQPPPITPHLSSFKLLHPSPLHHLSILLSPSRTWVRGKFVRSRKQQMLLSFQSTPSPHSPPPPSPLAANSHLLADPTLVLSSWISNTIQLIHCR